MPETCAEWDECVRLISSDCALLDILVRGARRHYERYRLCSERDVAWSRAVRKVNDNFFYGRRAAVHIC